MGRKKLPYVKKPNTFKLDKPAQDIIDPMPKMDKAKFVNRAILTEAYKCQHVWIVPGTEAICEKCGVRMSAIIERIKL